MILLWDRNRACRRRPQIFYRLDELRGLRRVGPKHLTQLGGVQQEKVGHRFCPNRYRDPPNIVPELRKTMLRQPCREPATLFVFDRQRREKGFQRRKYMETALEVLDQRVVRTAPDCNKRCPRL